VQTQPASARPRRPKRTITEAQFDRMVALSAQLAIVFIGAVLVVAVLKIGHAILTPVGLAIVVGLVFGPVADRLESRGVRPAFSAAIVVLMFVALLTLSLLLFAVPLAEWTARLPAIWARLQNELLNWRGQLEALSALQEQIDSALGGSGAMSVRVEDGSQILDIAMIAPAVLADMLIFLASLYFYLATRESIRISILSMIVSRRMRWRTAHVFDYIETKVSRFLLSVTLLNVLVGVAMTIVTFALGMPSPLLLGAVASLLNYIPYVGQAVMIATLLAVGFATQSDLLLILAPVGIYMLINLVEGQFVFPAFVGRIMTLNPFLIFFSIIFWFWVWGPVGSLMAVPSLIILQAVIESILPPREIKPSRPVRRTASMTAKDVVLANAAKAIREQTEEEAGREAEAKAAKLAEAEKAAEKPEATVTPPATARPKRKPVRRKKPASPAAVAGST
jgi:predicted PurR-regulated permease PerM